MIVRGVIKSLYLLYTASWIYFFFVGQCVIRMDRIILVSFITQAAMPIINGCNIMPCCKLTTLLTVTHKTALNLIRSIHECILYAAHLHQCMLHPVSYKVCVHVCVEWVEGSPAEQLHYTDRCFRETGSDLQLCASTQPDRQQSNEALVSPASCTCPEAWTAAPSAPSVCMSLSILLFRSIILILIKQSN